MKSLNYIYLFLIFLSIPFELSAQEYFFDIEIINVQQGLPNRRVQKVKQDLEGFIWISSPGKISRYDGFNFKTYDNEFLNINAAYPCNIAFDDAGLLWYSEFLSNSKFNESGVINTNTNERFDIETFSNGLIKNKSILYITLLDKDKTSIYIITHDNKIYRYSNKEFTLIFHHENYSFDRYQLALMRSKDNTYWIRTSKEILEVRNNKILNKYDFVRQVIEFMEQNGEISIITKVAGIFKSVKISDITSIDKYSDFKYSEYKQLIISRKDTFIVELGTDFINIKNTLKEIVFTYDYKAVFGPKNYIKPNSFLNDKQGVFWILTENGIIKIIPRKNNFNIISPNNSIRGITKVNNEVWYGGYRVNKTSNNLLKPILNNAFTKFTKGKQNEFWIGSTSLSLHKYNIAKDSIYKYSFDNHDLLVPFYNATNNSVLIGTDNGIVTFDPENEQFKKKKLPIESDDLEVRQFVEQGEYIWIVSSQGLLKMNKNTEKIIAVFNKTNGFPTINLNYLHIDKNGVFWIGTRGYGLTKWNQTTGELIIFSRENDLSNDNIYAVYEDDFNALWLPTDYGLNRMDKSTNEVRLFLPKDGIAHEEFNTFANYKDEDGRIYFGGLDGITSFHPRDFVKETYQPKLTVIDITKTESDKNTSIKIIDEYKDKGQVEVNHKTQNLSFTLALLDYANPKENQYIYKLKGFNNKWTYIESNNVTLSNLPSGNYNLLLKAKSPSGNRSNEIINIPIIVHPPFYQQSWFMALCLILTGLIIYSSINWRFAKLENDRLLLEKEVEKRTKTISQQTEELKALDKAKTQFFSNITHEFRTPLTLIIGPLEQLLKSDIQVTTRKKLNSVYKNANSLKDLINQLLDLSKIESGNMKIEYAHGDIIDYSRDLAERFKDIADKKQQILLFHTDLESWEVSFDKKKWNKIILNLLSNAIKFTPEKGKIQLTISKATINNNMAVKLQVKDNGIGISEAKQVNIFKRFYQADASTTRIQDGTGIGLALVKELVTLQKGTINLESELNHGSLFSIILPVSEQPLKTISITKIKPNKENLPLITTPVERETELEVQVQNLEQLELLIIEDNDEMRQYIRSCIDESLYKITEAKNGEIGIEKASNSIPDLIISDVMMPKKDGYDVVETIRKQASTSHIPIILLTAKSSLESKLKGLSRGADAYLTKPFSPEELVIRVQNLIELRKIFQIQIKENVENETALATNVSGKIFELENEFIIELKKYIEENIDNPNLTSESVATNFALSRMQLHRKLTALTGLSISLFIKKIRLTKATKLLKLGKLNISEVAYEVGFSSPAQFSRSFKKEFGKTPSQFIEYSKKSD